MTNSIRCQWVTDDPLYIDYHDKQWGVPVRDDQTLFEMLMLEGQQAGLSWLTVLKKRPRYRQQFANFSIQAVAAYTEQDLQRLLQDPGLIRNRRKLIAIVQNAKAAQRLLKSQVSLHDYLWSFVDGQPIIHAWQSHDQVPVMSAESKSMSIALKKIGFSFVGPTICYAFMQAVGMVWDHTVDCCCYENHA